jgi:hypothetical protein
MNDFAPLPSVPDGYKMDAKRRLVPVDQIKPQEVLEDDTVTRIMGYARDLSAQIARFHGHTFADVAAFQDLLSERYGASRGGTKGNVTLTSFDGCEKVVVQVADRLTFGPSLQTAKQLMDECIAEWSAGSRPEIQTLVQHAFEPNAAGEISREKIFALRRIEIDDPRWRAAVEAINDSVRTEGSKAYVRFYQRPVPEAKWEPVTINLASAGGTRAGTGAA